MTIEPIRNDEDLRRAFRRLESVFQAEEGSAQAGECDVLVTLIEDDENEHHGFGPAGPKRSWPSLNSKYRHGVEHQIPLRPGCRRRTLLRHANSGFHGPIRRSSRQPGCSSTRRARRHP
jgi:hypothetical protein